MLQIVFSCEKMNSKTSLVPLVNGSFLSNTNHPGLNVFRDECTSPLLEGLVAIAICMALPKILMTDLGTAILKGFLTQPKVGLCRLIDLVKILFVNIHI